LFWAKEQRRPDLGTGSRQHRCPDMAAAANAKHDTTRESDDYVDSIMSSTQFEQYADTKAQNTHSSTGACATEWTTVVSLLELSTAIVVGSGTANGQSGGFPQSFTVCGKYTPENPSCREGPEGLNISSVAPSPCSTFCLLPFRNCLHLRV